MSGAASWEPCTDFRAGRSPFAEQTSAIPRVMHRVLIAKDVATGAWIGSEGGAGTHSAPPAASEDVTDFREAAADFATHNPDFDLRWWHHDDCEAFLAAHYDARVLGAFRRHKAFACKADLMRLAILYRSGGWYGDLKHYALASLTDAFRGSGGGGATSGGPPLQWFSCCQDGVFLPPDVHAAMGDGLRAQLRRGDDFADAPELDEATKAYETRVALMQNGFLGAAAGHPFLRIALCRLVALAEAAAVGNNPWEPTGPALLMWSVASYFGEGDRLGRNMLFTPAAGATTPELTASAYVASVRERLPHPNFARFGRFVHAPGPLIDREVYKLDGPPGTVLVSHKGVFEERRAARRAAAAAAEQQRRPSMPSRRSSGAAFVSAKGAPGAGWRGLGGNNYLALWCARDMYDAREVEEPFASSRPRRGLLLVLTAALTAAAVVAVRRSTLS